VFLQESRRFAMNIEAMQHDDHPPAAVTTAAEVYSDANFDGIRPGMPTCHKAHSGICRSISINFKVQSKGFSR
jgi:hypothetical protein